MTIIFTPKKVLLTCFASLLFASCFSPKDDKKGVGYNSYTEQITDSHLMVREQIKNMRDSMEFLTDSGDFGMRIFPLLNQIEMLDAGVEAKPQSHQDSLLYGSHKRMTQEYFNIAMQDFRELFNLYSKGNIDRPKIDAIKRRISVNDSISLKYFNKYLNGNTTFEAL